MPKKHKSKGKIGPTLVIPDKQTLVIPHIDAEGLYDVDVPDRDILTAKGRNTFLMHLPLDPFIAAQIRVKPHREGHVGVTFDMEAHNRRVFKALQPVHKSKTEKLDTH